MVQAALPTLSLSAQVFPSNPQPLPHTKGLGHVTSEAPTSPDSFLLSQPLAIRGQLQLGHMKPTQATNAVPVPRWLPSPGTLFSH